MVSTLPLLSSLISAITPDRGKPWPDPFTRQIFLGQDPCLSPAQSAESLAFTLFLLLWQTT